MASLLLNPEEVVTAQARWTAEWHEAPTAIRMDAPWSFIEQNHRMNFELWHEEDVARRDNLGAERVRQAKRAIDRFNQSRNDAVEAMDQWLLARLPARAGAGPMHSETPGMIIDRLSILALKLYHMRLEAERSSAGEPHRLQCAHKCRVLEEQLKDLQDCLGGLLMELEKGTRRFKLYRQFKMYNDPNLNPELYGE